MASGGDDRAVVVRDYIREDDQRRIISITVLRVPESDAYSEGIKYAFQYGTPEGDTFLRYDNAPGTHERHPPDGTDELDYPGIAVLYRRFRAEINDL